MRDLNSGARAKVQHAAARAQRVRWAPDVIASVERDRRSGGALIAGGLAYRLFFWLVAFGLVLAAAGSFWVRSDRGSLVDAARSFGLSGVAARSAASAVQEGSNGRWYLLAMGLALLAYFGAGSVRALRVAAFVAWQLAPARARHLGRASAALTGLMIVALGVALLASWIRHHDAALGVLATTATVAAFFALALLAFAMLPHAAGSDWRSLVPGAALVGVGVTAMHLFIAYYLYGRLERAPDLYGTLGSSTVVLLALFLIARVFVAGLFLNAALDGRRRAGGDAPP